MKVKKKKKMTERRFSMSKQARLFSLPYPGHLNARLLRRVVSRLKGGGRRVLTMECVSIPRTCRVCRGFIGMVYVVWTTKMSCLSIDQAP